MVAGAAQLPHLKPDQEGIKLSTKTSYRMPREAGSLERERILPREDGEEQLDHFPSSKAKAKKYQSCLFWALSTLILILFLACIMLAVELAKAKSKTLDPIWPGRYLLRNHLSRIQC